jgi:hypothetical protein
MFQRESCCPEIHPETRPFVFKPWLSPIRKSVKLSKSQFPSLAVSRDNDNTYTKEICDDQINYLMQSVRTVPGTW